MTFPVKQITTKKSWEELTVNDQVKSQVHELIEKLTPAGEAVKSTEPAKLSRGYRALFYGPPKSGKKATAAFIAKETGREVYRFDLSQIVSKYIGETEKNLELLFARAEDKGWILFFDEADALFGKRTDVKDSHDRYANIEISYLQENIWHYPGLVIVTTKKKKKIDEEYIKKFDVVLDFNTEDQASEETEKEEG